MPRLLEERDIRIEWSDIDAMVPKTKVCDSARSSGVHLSGVIKYVMTTAGLLTPEEYNDEMPLRMWLGMAFEAHAVQLWPGLIWQPGECSRDGIIGSPDGITEGFKPGCTCLEEFKLTWMSRLEPGHPKGSVPPPRRILAMKRWMLQIAGYCHMMGLTMARLHVCWVMGDYRASGPQYFTYLIQFTEEELERMWDNMILPNVGGATPEVH